MKNIRINIIIKVLVFVIFISGVLIFTDSIIKAKFIGDSTSIVNGFYSEKRNSIDLLVIGSSNSFCTIDPVTLYEDYGITAYDFGSSSQPLNISLLYIKEALKKQNPKVVALEANMLIGDCMQRGNEAALRWGYTDIPLSVNKLRAVYQSLGKVDKEYFTYIFPVFRYHNRWKELSKTDYIYWKQDKTNYSKGYLQTQSVCAEPVRLDFYYDYQNIDYEHYVSSEALEYIDEIKKICDKKGISLLLFKSPKQGWYAADTEAVRLIANERNLEFIDYNELYNNGMFMLDTINDFRDADHLNDFGAKKVSGDFGRIIVEKYGLTDNRNPAEPSEAQADKYASWEEAVSYRHRQGWQLYMEAVTAKECIELLQNEPQYVLIVTDAKSGANNDRVHQWVYSDGKILVDQIWEDTGIRHLKIGESELVLSKFGALHQVLIDGVENYEADSRWNIIIYDKNCKEVVGRMKYEN